jgi:hypothetical protein
MRSPFLRLPKTPPRSSSTTAEFVAQARLPRIELATCAMCQARFLFVPHRYLCWSCREVFRSAVPYEVVSDDVTVRLVTTV